MLADETEELASTWLAREDRGLTDEEREAFEAWLAKSSWNKIVYLRLKAAWQRTERLAALKRPAINPGRARSRLGSAIRIPVFAVVLLALFFGVRVYLEPSRQHGLIYATGLGQTQAYQLSDGTRMELNTNSRVRTNVTADQRFVTLESGEAYFDVAHDAKHPFVVYVGSRRVTDLGTKFSVFLNGDNVQVLVREGRVRLDMPGSAASMPIFVDGGHVVIAQGQEIMVFAKPDREIANDLSWRKGMLVFDQLPLTEVAAQFNRYNAKHIFVEGGARKIHIGGSFKADNVHAFLLLLHQGFGLSVSEQGDKIVVSQ